MGYAYFPQKNLHNALELLVSGDGNAPLHIHQNAYIYGGRLTTSQVITHPIHYQAYLLVSKGTVQVDGQIIKAGDGAEITKVTSCTITVKQDAEILVIDVP